LPDVIRGAHQQDFVSLMLEQRNLFQKLVRDGLVDPVRGIAAARDLVELIDKDLLQVS